MPWRIYVGLPFRELPPVQSRPHFQQYINVKLIANISSSMHNPNDLTEILKKNLSSKWLTCNIWMNEWTQVHSWEYPSTCNSPYTQRQQLREWWVKDARRTVIAPMLDRDKNRCMQHEIDAYFFFNELAIGKICKHVPLNEETNTLPIYLLERFAVMKTFFIRLYIFKPISCVLQCRH